MDPLEEAEGAITDIKAGQVNIPEVVALRASCRTLLQGDTSPQSPLPLGLMEILFMGLLRMGHLLLFWVGN